MDLSASTFLLDNSARADDWARHVDVALGKIDQMYEEGQLGSKDGKESGKDGKDDGKDDGNYGKDDGNFGKDGKDSSNRNSAYSTTSTSSTTASTTTSASKDGNYRNSRNYGKDGNDVSAHEKGWVRVASKQLVGVLLMVWARCGHVAAGVSEVATATVATGIMNVMVRKGKGSGREVVCQH